VGQFSDRNKWELWMTDVIVFISFDVLDATRIIPSWLNQHYTENVIDRRFLNIWWSHKLQCKSLLAVHNCLFTVTLHIWEQSPSCASLTSYLDVSLWRSETNASDSGLCPIVVFNLLVTRLVSDRLHLSNCSSWLRHWYQ